MVAQLSVANNQAGGISVQVQLVQALQQGQTFNRPEPRQDRLPQSSQRRIKIKPYGFIVDQAGAGMGQGTLGVDLPGAAQYPSGKRRQIQSRFPLNITGGGDYRLAPGQGRKLLGQTVSAGLVAPQKRDHKPAGFIQAKDSRVGIFMADQRGNGPDRSEER